MSVRFQGKGCEGAIIYLFMCRKSSTKVNVVFIISKKTIVILKFISTLNDFLWRWSSLISE